MKWLYLGPETASGVLHKVKGAEWATTDSGIFTNRSGNDSALLGKGNNTATFITYGILIHTSNNGATTTNMNDSNSANPNKGKKGGQTGSMHRDEETSTAHPGTSRLCGAHQAGWASPTGNPYAHSRLATDQLFPMYTPTNSAVQWGRHSQRRPALPGPQEGARRKNITIVNSTYVTSYQKICSKFFEKI